MIEESDQHVLDLWKSFDLTARKVALDKSLIELRETKGVAVERRKELNASTKRFRGLEKNEQLNALTELLKEYQNEIDLLTKRSKLGEAAFVGLYKAIYEVPDPVSTMDALITKIRSSSGSNLVGYVPSVQRT
jgi:homeobox protein cut-like